MRTTLTLEDSLAHELKKIAQNHDKSFKQVVNEMLTMGLLMYKQPQSSPQTYTLKTVSLGKPHAGIDLQKSLQLADELEDEAILQKLGMRK